MQNGSTEAYSSASTLSQKLCGVHKNLHYESTIKDLTVLLFSDYTETRKGFTATYSKSLVQNAGRLYVARNLFRICLRITFLARVRDYHLLGLASYQWFHSVHYSDDNKNNNGHRIKNVTCKQIIFLLNCYNAIFPKWSRTLIEFGEFSEFRESHKSLKHELDSI